MTDKPLSTREVSVNFGTIEVFRPHPVFQVVGIGPHREEHRDWRVKGTRDEKFIVAESGVHLRFPFFFISTR